MSSTDNFSAESLAVLQIARTPGIGPVSYKKSVSKAGSATRLLAQWKNFFSDKPLIDNAIVQRELETLYDNNGWCVVLGASDYPPLLAQIPDAPLVLYGLGDKSWLSQKQVAVIGNRNASAAGLNWTRALASELVAGGLTITSGLARGIDSAAHRGALDAHGGTIAVCAGGPNHVYPPENDKLRQQIIETGCLVTEQPWGQPPIASFFARRNRIIAGLSLGVVISEAGRESGTLITARCALDYGREVWAVPGSPTDPRAGGPNWLLKQGAVLIENAADIFSTLPSGDSSAPKRHIPQLNLFAADETKATEVAAAEEMAPLPAQGLAGLLGRSGVTLDVLVRQSGQPEAAVMAELVELEILGQAVREADGRWRRA